jgi:hypothetical protein
MGKFLKRLQVLLSSLGFDVKLDGPYITVNGAKFVASCRAHEDGRTVVEFLGGNFIIQKDGAFNDDRALGMLLMELPKRLQAERSIRLSEKFGYCLGGQGYWIVSHLRLSRVADGVSVGPLDSKVVVFFESDDEDELRRAVEFLSKKSEVLKHTVEEKAEPQPQENRDAG